MTWRLPENPNGADVIAQQILLAAILLVALPWLLQIMSDYSIDLIHNIPDVISGSGR